MNFDGLTQEQWYRLLMGSDLAYDFPAQEWEDDAISLFASTKYPLRPLGHTKEGRRIEIAEEDRSHGYIIGSTQEGKSKFIEHLVRGDIKRGLGCCVLDPSSGGKTIYSILKYCVKNNVQNVLLIDPRYAYQFPFKVPQLSPFSYSKNKQQAQSRSTRILRDTLRVIYRDDPQITTRVNRYMPAVITALYNAKASLHDSRFFTERSFHEERQRILEHTPKKHPARVALETIYGDDTKARANYEQAISTILRLDPLINDILGLMFMSPVGINFYKLVKERWVILVNLETTDVFGELESKLLGTLIINQILSAVYLYSRPFEAEGLTPPPYYLYIDEAGEYVGDKLARTMELAQKTGLRVTIGHQSSAQFSEPGVLNRIMTVAKMRVQFSLPGSSDRARMGREMGEAERGEEALAVQEANIELPKVGTFRVRTPTVKPLKVPPGDVKEFIYNLYKQPWYLDAKALQKKLEQEYAATNPRATEPGKSDGKTTDENPVSERIPVSERRRRYKARQSGEGTDTAPHKTAPSE